MPKEVISIHKCLDKNVVPKKEIRPPMTKRAQSLTPPKRLPSPASNGKRALSLSASTPASKKSLINDVNLPEMSASAPIALTADYIKNTDCKEPVLPQCVIMKMQRLLATKRREFMKSRKSLIQLQNSFLEQYAAVRDLETRSGKSSSAEDPIGDIKIVSITGWSPHDLLMMLSPELDLTFNCEISGIFGPQVLQQIHSLLNPIPEEVLNMAADIMARRIEMLNLLRGKFHKVERPSSNLEWKNKNNELDQDTEKLHRMVAVLVENLTAKINFILRLIKVPWLDREALIKRVEHLQKENMILQNRLEDLKKNEDGKSLKTIESSSNTQALRDELAKEKAAREALKDVVSAAEGMLRVARARVATLERLQKETKLELDGVKKKYKELEQLHRHRESSYDARSKKLLEVSKTGEMTIETLSRQRDALEIRVKELREQAEAAEKQAEMRETEQKILIETLQAKVAKQENHKKSMVLRAEELEKKIKDMEEQYFALRERSFSLVDAERKRCLEYIPSKENEPSVQETEIWKELQATKVALSKVEEELRICRADKDNFLNSLTKIAQVDGEVSKEKIAYELLEREKKIASLQHIIDELRENETSMEHTMTQYENQLAALRLEVKKLRHYDCYSNELPQQKLETEVLDLQIQVETLSRERNSWISAAASRALMLERHERAAELFARMTRARRELAALLEGGRELEPFDDDLRTEISRSLSAICVNASDTWSALREERSRIITLENAVLAQTSQLEREERVRTQLERKRTLLERELLRAQYLNHEPSHRHKTSRFRLI